MAHARRQILSFVASFQNDYFHNVHDFFPSSFGWDAIVDGFDSIVSIFYSFSCCFNSSRTKTFKIYGLSNWIVRKSNDESRSVQWTLHTNDNNQKGGRKWNGTNGKKWFKYWSSCSLVKWLFKYWKWWLLLVVRLSFGSVFPPMEKLIVFFSSRDKKKCHDEFVNAQICQNGWFHYLSNRFALIKVFVWYFSFGFYLKSRWICQSIIWPKWMHFDGFNCHAWGILTGLKSIGLFSIPFSGWRDIITASIWKQNKKTFI